MILKKLLLSVCLFTCCLLQSIAQKKYTISGYITDVETGEQLIAANILDQKSTAGAITNTYGFFSLTLPKDSVLLSFSYIGYESQTIPLWLDKDVTLEINLSPALSLAAVEVVGEKFQKIEESSQMSRIEVPVEQK